MFSALRNRDYRLYWVGTLVSWIGSHLQGAVQSWYVFDITHQSYYVGLVGFFGQIPMVLTLLGGVVADRVDKRRLLIVAQSGMMLSAFTLGLLIDMHRAQVWSIAVLAALAGVAAAFETPTRHALPIQVVGKRSLTNAIALNSAAFNVARIVGPALAGILMGKIGVAKCFYANGISYIAVIAALSMMKADTSPTANSENALWKDLRAGMAYVYRRPVIRTLVLMGAIPSLFVLPYLTLMPELATKTLNLKATGYGALMSSVGIGAVLGALRMAGDGRDTGRGRFLLMAAAINGSMLLLLCLSRIYLVSMCLFAVLGAASVTYNQTINTLIQTLADEEFRARALSAFLFVFIGCAPIGSLVAGLIASRFGVAVPLVIGGASVWLLVGLITVTQPDIRRL